MSAVLSSPFAATPSMETRADPSPLRPPPPLTALDRLNASRARLRGAMLDIRHPPKRASTFADGADLGDVLRATLKKIPGATLLLESIESWWEQHPLRTAGMVAEEAARSFVVPLARQSPYAFVGGALVFGAALMFARPWRWLIRPALFMGIVPQILAHLVKRVPAASLVGVLNGFQQRRRRRKTAAKASAPPAAPGPRTSGMP